jgi:hypothetical protein
MEFQDELHPAEIEEKYMRETKFISRLANLISAFVCIPLYIYSM